MYENNNFPKRTRITIPELVNRFPKGVTLVHAKLIDSKYGPNIICHIAEDEEIYFFGGKILSERFEKLCSECRTGEFGINMAMANGGGYPLCYMKRRAKDGTEYYSPLLVTE